MPTTQPTPEHTAHEQILTEFRAWVLTLGHDRLAALGIHNSVEEPLRLLRGFAAEKGLTLH